MRRAPMGDGRVGAAGRIIQAVATAALLVVSSGCSLILDFDEKADAGPTIDAALADAGPVGDGGDPCTAFEPNETLNTAYALEAGNYSPLGICPAGDVDFFSFEVTGTEDVVIEALFTNAPGMDLEMRLYDGTGVVIDRSETFDSNERIERSAAGGTLLAAGTYFVEIFGFGNSDTNTYVLNLEITTP